MADIATVTGSRTVAKCTGAETSSSSVPCQRSRCIAEPADVLVDDQIPITAAPNDAKTSDSPPAPARNMRNAIVAKKSGQRTPSSPSKDERIIIFRCSANPRPRTRATRSDERVPVAAGSPSAIRRYRLLGDERDVRVLEGRLARRHAAERDAVEAREHVVGRLAAGLGLDDDDLCLVAVLDGDRRDAVDLAERLDLAVLDAVHLDLDDDAVGHLLLEVARRPLRDDPPARDDGDAVAERVRLEHVVRRQEHGLARLLQAEDRLPELTRADGVDADRRLVEEDHRRVVQEPAGDVQPLAHAARVALDPLLLAALEPDELEQLLDPRPLAARLDAVELREVAQVVERREALVEAPVAAEHVADALPHPARVLDDVASEHPRLPGCRDEERDQHLDRRRLAGAVRAEEAEELALLDREADAADRLDLERAAPERAGGRPVGAV